MIAQLFIREVVEQIGRDIAPCHRCENFLFVFRRKGIDESVLPGLRISEVYKFCTFNHFPKNRQSMANHIAAAQRRFDNGHPEAFEEAGERHDARNM